MSNITALGSTEGWTYAPRDLGNAIISALCGSAHMSNQHTLLLIASNSSFISLEPRPQGTALAYAWFRCSIHIRITPPARRPVPLLPMGNFNALAVEVKTTTGRIDSWDLLRGVAVGFVLLRHAWPDIFAGAGVTGVTMFFGLSGFLITDIIQAEIRKTGKLSYKRFYLNRGFRLLPALVVVLIAYVAVELLTGRMRDSNPLLSLVVGIGYVANVPGIHLGSGLGHLWTLAVEEQFYLVWPVLLIIALRKAKVGAVIASILAISMVLTSAALLLAPTTATVYTLPTSWVPALIIGAASRMYLEQVRRFADLRWLQLVAAVVLVGFCFFPQAKDLPLTYLLFGPIIAVSVATLVVAGIALPRVPRVLSPLTLLGRISYGTYLWNFVIVCWLRGSVDGEGFALEGVLLTLAAGVASWFLIEQPSQRLKKKMLARSSRVPNREFTRT